MFFLQLLKKADEDIDVETERAFYSNPANKDNPTIIWLEKGKLKAKDEENTFSRVCTRFYQTMAKAQGNTFYCQLPHSVC